ncbi:MAG: helix-turn-helix transcriptional regulator [Flavobacterium sp.]
MIKNEKQYGITKNKLKTFKDALDLLANSDIDHEGLLYKLKYDSINSQIEVFNKELLEYERLKSGESLCVSKDISNLTSGIIEARIAKGYNHKQMAELLDTSEQQVQKYESEDYLNISVKKMQQIISALGIDMRSTFQFKKSEEKRNDFLIPAGLDAEAIQMRIRNNGSTVKICAH